MDCPSNSAINARRRWGRRCAVPSMGASLAAVGWGLFLCLCLSLSLSVPVPVPVPASLHFWTERLSQALRTHGKMGTGWPDLWCRQGVIARGDERACAHSNPLSLISSSTLICQARIMREKQRKKTTGRGPGERRGWRGVGRKLLKITVFSFWWQYIKAQLLALWYLNPRRFPRKTASAQ